MEEEVKRNVVNTEVANNAIHETILEKNGDVKTIEVEPVQQKTDLPSSASKSRESKSTGFFSYFCLHFQIISRNSDFFFVIN